MLTYQHRLLEQPIEETLKRHKSILLLGPRQTGKTTLLQQACQPDFNFNLIIPKVRQQFERDPDSLIQEIKAFQSTHQTCPLVIIDEIQKVPVLMDVAQYLIDMNLAQFILTGSSARKLKHHQEHSINLLPGRVVLMQLDGFSLSEMHPTLPSLESLLLNGSLPGIYLLNDSHHEEIDLRSYVETYLEEEVRKEALVRNLGAFSRFLELAASSLAEPINFTKLSQEIGVGVHTLIEYYQILEDCLIVHRISPIVDSSSRRRLTKAPKFIFFDLGVRRLCAREGIAPSLQTLAHLFEQFVGMELIKYLHLKAPTYRLKYWRDHNGPEVDYVLDMNHRYLPIEVKWTTAPSRQDCRHLEKFIQEYACEKAYLICRIERPREICEGIMALPWQDLPHICDDF